MQGEGLGRENQKFRFECISIEMPVRCPSEGVKSIAGYLYWSPGKSLDLRENFMSH